MTAGTTSPAVGNELFLHNMRVLWRTDAALAARVDAVHDDERLPIEPTRSGDFTVRVPLAGGQAVYLHSKYDPTSEAKRLADTLDVDKRYCFVVSGLGLGYHIIEMGAKLRGDAFILCAEPSLALIATAMTCVDFTGLLTRGQLVILHDNDKARLHALLEQRGTLLMLGAQFVAHPPSKRVAEAAHRQITDAVSEFVTFKRMSLLTLVSNSKITCKNIAMNLVNYVRTPSLDLLRDRFAGDPAIVVAAGPSLARNIDQLAPLKGKAVLCAVQTALDPLTKHGIIPDFATSLDFHEMSRKFFEGVDHLERIHLVAEPKATWHVIDEYPGPVSLLHNGWAQLILGERLGKRGGLPAGATVAHLAFYLAAYMGCDPIILVGQDLAFTGHVFYVPGVEIHRTWQSEINRFHTMEYKEWERIVRNRPILRRVPGALGGELYTDDLLFTYLEQFEKDVAAVPARVIHATEGGARIRGTASMTLAEASRTFCTRQIDPAKFAYIDATPWRDPKLLPEAATAVRHRLDALEEAAGVCDELLRLFDQLKGLTGDPRRFNQRLTRVDELRAKVQQDTSVYMIVNAATQLTELRRYSADRVLTAFEGDDVERAKRQLDRDTEFITGVREGIADVKPILEAALDRIRKAEP